MKAARGKEQLAKSGMGWVEDFSPLGVRLIGIAEVLGALGVILPHALDIAPILSPIAAACLAATMIGAIVVHLRRKETKQIVPPLVLGILAAVVSVLLFLG
jgi:hypothetical protein